MARAKHKRADWSNPSASFNVYQNQAENLGNTATTPTVCDTYHEQRPKACPSQCSMLNS